jgi:hypothetical protein
MEDLPTTAVHPGRPAIVPSAGPDIARHRPGHTTIHQTMTIGSGLRTTTKTLPASDAAARLADGLIPRSCNWRSTS